MKSKTPETAIILAAGVGSRLRPVTNHVPKCLVRVANKPMLQHQLEALEAAGIAKVYIVTGYRAAQVRQFLAGFSTKMDVRTLENREFDATNNMYSLHLALEEVGASKPLLLMNGDLVFGPELLAEFLGASLENGVATYPGKYVQESMKLKVRADGSIEAISKAIPEDVAYGISLDIYRFAPAALQHLHKRIGESLRHDRKQWTEVALDAAFRDAAVVAHPITIEHPWTEIDDFRDLQEAELAFNPAAASLANKKAFFFDGDGTLYVEDDVLPGAREAIQEIKRRGKKAYFLTNNSSKSHAEYAHRLQQMGLDFTPGEIITSADIAFQYLKEQGVARLHVMGTPALEAEAKTAGFQLTEDDPQAILVGYDTTLTYPKLRTVSRLIAKRVPLVATHGDKFCPTADGPIPDAGAMLAMLEAATGATATVLGKPDPRMILNTLRDQGYAKSDVAHFGDRLHTDVWMGKRAGVMTVCVLTGEATRDEIERASARPDLVLADLRGLMALFDAKPGRP